MKSQQYILLTMSKSLMIVGYKIANHMILPIFHLFLIAFLLLTSHLLGGPIRYLPARINVLLYLNKKTKPITYEFFGSNDLMKK